MNDIKKMHDKKYLHVFVDIFDTIIFRKIQPEFTKKIWANHIVKRLELEDYSMIDIYELRSRIELRLGEETYNLGKDWEFTYIDLLKEMYKELDLKKYKIKITEFITLATNIEIEIESIVQEPDKKMISELKKAKKMGKKIYCISDMYLSKNMINTIFTNIGINDIFNDIFVSCEYLENKKSGRIFDIVLKKLKVNAKKCIMIGDNQYSDYENPKAKGIDAIKLDRTDIYQKYEEYLQNNSEQKVIEKFTTLANVNSNNFEHSIFTLYQFIEKLYYKLLNDGLEEVFFLSREGEFLKKLFDDYNSKVFGKKIKTHYILVSRKATYLPSLKELPKEDFGGLLRQYLNSSISEFLGSLNFTKTERTTILNSFQEDCRKLNVTKLKKFDKEATEAILKGDFEYKVVYLYGSKLLKLLKKNEDFINIYEKNRVEQNKLFKKYIKQYTNKKNICVVDIGWNGSIQDNIQNILGKDYHVTGYLYGLINRNPERCKNKQGLIFTNVPDISKNYELFGENRTVFEILLGASHGSANKYKEVNKKVEVSTFEKEEESHIYNTKISKIQKSMFEIYEGLEDILINGYYDNKKIDKAINNIHFNMLFDPTKEQLHFFNEIYHYENFGVFEFSKFNLKREFTLPFYIKENAKYILKRKSFFNDAFWPTLKLHNEKLFIPKILYRTHKKFKLKRKGVI